MAGAAAERWVAVVTGGNKGIGLEIVRQLVLRTRGSITVVLTARSQERGLAAVVRLKSELAAHLSMTGEDVDMDMALVFHPLDVRSSESVAALASWLAEHYKGLDILVNNAAMSCGDRLSSEGAQMVLDTNYFGVKRVTKGLLHLARPAGALRIVNVSSTLGQRKIVGEALTRELADPDSLTEEKIDGFVSRFLHDVQDAGTFDAKGWPTEYPPAYCVSKVAVNAYTRLLARQVGHRNIYVNCVHPGYVSTDLNDHQGHLTTEEGADTPVWLALLPPSPDLPRGKFLDQRRLQDY